MIVNAGLLFAIVLLLRPTLTYGREHVMTQKAYDRAISLLQADAVAVAALPGLRPGSTPIWKLHPVGSKVHGTVVMFHGFSGNAVASVQQANYFYNAGFNVYAGNLPGFAQTDEYWVRTTLRDTAGFNEARIALLRDSRIRNAIQIFANASGQQPPSLGNIVEVFREVIQRELPIDLQTEVFAAFDVLSPFRSANPPDFKRSLNEYFFSDHLRYEGAISTLSLVQPLPGPVFAVGVSFGGPNVVNVAARSGIVQSAALLAPFFGNTGPTSDLQYLLSIAGALELLKYPLFGQPVRTSTFTAANIFPQLVTRDEIIRAARETTKILCIVAEDDTFIDTARTREVCDSKLGGRSLVYPKNLGVGHFITPETGNKYSNAMLAQIVSFFVNDTSSQSDLLIPNL